MRAAEYGVFEILGVPAGALGARAGRKMRHSRPLSGLRCSHDLPFQIVSLPLGGGVPRRCLRESSSIVKELRGIFARPVAASRFFRQRTRARNKLALVPTFRSSCCISAPTFRELRKVMGTSVPVLTFVSYRGGFVYECQNQRDTGKCWILVWFWI